MLKTMGVWAGSFEEGIVWFKQICSIWYEESINFECLDFREIVLSIIVRSLKNDAVCDQLLKLMSIKKNWDLGKQIDSQYCINALSHKVIILSL